VWEEVSALPFDFSKSWSWSIGWTSLTEERRRCCLPNNDCHCFSLQKARALETAWIANRKLHLLATVSIPGRDLEGDDFWIWLLSFTPGECECLLHDGIGGLIDPALECLVNVP
jgi:hypothetical protein